MKKFMAVKKLELYQKIKKVFVILTLGCSLRNYKIKPKVSKGRETIKIIVNINEIQTEK